ncbi:unnamed protein product [Ixodes pacificus]
MVWVNKPEQSDEFCSGKRKQVVNSFHRYQQSVYLLSATDVLTRDHLCKQFKQTFFFFSTCEGE